MSATPSPREHATLEMAFIDPPQLDARIDRDPEKLEELARDIMRRGLIQPIHVVRVEHRYELVDGFRRFLAAKMAGLTTIECFIYATKDAALEGVKYAANIFREDMSAAEEAVMFHQLLTHECGNDIEHLCSLVNKKLSYVDSRLLLLAGDELIFEALKTRQITIGVAQELNKCTDPEYRRYYLSHAVKGGATISVVAGWVQEWKSIFGDQPAKSAPATPATGPTMAAADDPHRCYICKRSDARHVPETILVHSHCRLALLDPILEGRQPDEQYEAAATDPRRT